MIAGPWNQIFLTVRSCPIAAFGWIAFDLSGHPAIRHERNSRHKHADRVNQLAIRRRQE